MTVIKHTFDYEILLRLGEDGLQGAHFVSITQFKDDKTGEVISAMENAPVSLSVRDADSNTDRTLSEILGSAVADTIIENEQLRLDNGNQDVQIIELTQEVSDQREHIIELEKQIDIMLCDLKYAQGQLVERGLDGE